MASRDDQQPAATAAQIQPQTDALPTSTPVELSHLAASRQHDEPVSPMSPSADQFTTPPTSARHSTFTSAMQGVSPLHEEEPSTAGAQQTIGQDAGAETTAARVAAAPVVAETTSAGEDEDKGPLTPPKEPQLEKKPSSLSAIQPTATNQPAIGPATSQTNVATTAQPADDPANPSLQLHILLTTGQRHPFNISRAYLQKRGVSATKTRNNPSGAIDPYSISGYTLKELIWKDWRSEWDFQPSSPSGIRLISLGRLVDDNKPLSDYFSRDREATSSNHVVHMTVKPADMEDDDTYKKKHKSSVDGEESAGCCRCCTIM